MNPGIDDELYQTLFSGFVKRELRAVGWLSQSRLECENHSAFFCVRCLKNLIPLREIESGCSAGAHTLNRARAA